MRFSCSDSWERAFLEYEYESKSESDVRGRVVLEHLYHGFGLGLAAKIERSFELPGGHAAGVFS